MNHPSKSNTKTAPLISLGAENLSCIRGNQEVFSSIGFEVGSGELLLLRGPNGSGKSSLLMCLAGILSFQGKLDWNLSQNLPPDTRPLELIHYAGHLNAMKPELTLAENLRFWSALFGGDEKRIGLALENAGLGGLDHYHAGHLSAGQKHRLSLARLLVSPRPLWLLDEPSSALDAEGDQWVGGLITTHLKEGGIVIAATHRPISAGPGTLVQTITLGDN